MDYTVENELSNIILGCAIEVHKQLGPGLFEYLQNDALFRRFFDVFIFEALPAQDRNAHDVYIDEVKKCDIYLGLLGKEYGFEFEDGTSPTQ